MATVSSANSEDPVGSAECVRIDPIMAEAPEVPASLSDTVLPSDNATTTHSDLESPKQVDPENLDTTANFSLQHQNTSKLLPSECDRVISDSGCKNLKKVDIFVEDSGPKWHKVYGNIVTPPFIPNKLVDAFDSLPIFGKPDSIENLQDYQQKKLRSFIGFDLNDDEFQKLSDYCR